MADINSLEQRVAALEKLLKLKVLGNDTSTNYGLPAQTILYGLQQAGALSLTKNNVRTSINNDIDPDLGETVSLESEDISAPNGGKSAVAANGFLVLVWDGAAYQTISFIGDDGGGFGAVTLNGAGSSHNITIDASNPLITITDGAGHTSSLLPNGIIVDNGIGIDAVVVAGAVTMTFVKGILVSAV